MHNSRLRNRTGHRGLTRPAGRRITFTRIDKRCSLSNMTWVVDRKSGDVTYRLNGEDAFINVAKKIRRIDSREAPLFARSSGQGRVFVNMVNMQGEPLKGYQHWFNPAV